MAPNLESFLGGSLVLMDPQVHGPMMVVPIRGAPHRVPYIGLDAALELGVQVRELDSPDVNRVLVRNPTAHPVLLLDGEEIAGAKQNRIVHGTVVVPASADRVVSVFCVEQERWDDGSRVFGTSRQVAPPSLRAVASRSSRSRGGGQHDVWTQVRTIADRTSTVTRTLAITDVFEARGEELDRLAGAFAVVPGQQGMAVVVGSRIWAIELLTDAATFARLHPRLLRGHALDAIQHARAPSPAVHVAEVREMLSRVLRCPLRLVASEGAQQRYAFAEAGDSGEVGTAFDAARPPGAFVEGAVTALDGQLVALHALLSGAPQGHAAPDRPRTSASQPIEVTWLGALDGRIGITFAPGKHASSAMGGAPWRRDLELDLVRLRHHHGVGALVCLLSDGELARLRVRDYAARVEAHGMALLRMPIIDGDVPRSMEEVEALAGQVLALLARGERVVVHCRGGLGRAGTIAGCVMVAGGASAEAALSALRARHRHACPENDRQRAFVRAFAERRHARAG